MDSFQLWWLVSLAALLVLALLVGRLTGQGILGILIDGRGRYSLTHFQIVLWTIVILSSLLAVLMSQGPKGDFHLTPQLLGLMGISAGSGVLAAGVKGSKDAKDAPGAAVKVARVGLFTPSSGVTRIITPRIAQMWLEEEGDHADLVVSITKYQNFIFTLVVIGFYFAAAWKSGTLPVLPDNIVALLGISHAGYVGGKVPDKK